MERILGRYSSQAYALLRIVAGFMFVAHGTQKLLGTPGSATVVSAGSLPWVAGVIELVAGALILLGLFTTIAAFIASGEMAAAYFMAHAPGSFWPIINRGELAVLYCFVFLYIASQGPGIWSLDGLRRRGMRAGPAARVA